ncbi:rhodanese-like domain-containing protein [Bacillus sp. JJ664]
MKQITPKEVEELLSKGEKLNIVDVREVEELESGNIRGILNIPLGLLEFRMHELDKSKEYILVCRSGGRSGRACQLLDSQGYNVMNMTGGMLEWEGELN